MIVRVLFCYWCIGLCLLIWNIPKIKELSWNKKRYLGFTGIFLRHVVIDILEIIFWPYILWRIYKLP